MINKYMMNIIDTKLFVRFLLLNVMASSIVFVQGFACDRQGILTMVSIAALVALGICLVSSALRKVKWLQKGFEGICCGGILLILLVEVFLLEHFGMLFDENVLRIVEGTNADESRDFLATYANAETLLSFLGVMACWAIAWFVVPCLTERLPKIVMRVFIVVLLLMGIGKVGYSVYSTIQYGFGGRLAAYSSFSRIGRCVWIHLNTTRETDRLIGNLQTMETPTGAPTCDKVVVIIGESYSKYHSSLYGYEKNTSPLLGKRIAEGELLLFTDVVTPMNDTERAFRAIYSLGELYGGTYSDYTLFPYVFKQAGFRTVNFDNMDMAYETSRVKDSKKLSEVMFDYRNTATYSYDGEMTDWWKNDIQNGERSLYVIKLKGQHYAYANTFPADFARFTVADYTHRDLSDAQKQMMADYDNSTLYNDSIVDVLIGTLEDKQAVLLYFSDHGEEIYDARDYMGHGGTSPYLHYQVEVPFMVWMSDEYKQNHPAIVENLKRNREKPYTTDDVAHTILDLAGISCAQFVPQRSLANDNFTPRSQRIVNKTLVYEELK